MNATLVKEPKEVAKIEEGMKREPSGLWKVLVCWVAVGAAIYHLYALFIGLTVSIKLNAAHLSFVLSLTFLTYGLTKKQAQSGKIPMLDIFLAILATAPGLYLIFAYESYIARTALPTSLEIALGILLIVLILEAGRRSSGLALPIIALVFIAYVFLGQYIPRPLGHYGYKLSRFTTTEFLSTAGIFGEAVRASATMIVMFTLFGSFLMQSGAGKVLMDLAFSIAGRMTGGPAKVAVVSSGLFGMVSGSAVANVVTTGQFTIPLMKKYGFRPEFAGATEAVASTGGVLAPPVMGAAAFIMSEVIGIPYSTIAAAAIIPSFVYYGAAFLMVHLEATKLGLRGQPASELPDFKSSLKGSFHIVIPVVILIILIVRHIPIMRAALYGIVVLLVFASLRKETRPGFWTIVNALQGGFKQILSVAVACALAGIVIGVVKMTGMGITLGNILTSLSGGMIFPALLLTALLLIILGMGLPATAAYIIGASIAGPFLNTIGIPLLPAHMFIFYFSLISTLTPPVCLAAYAGASLAGSNTFRTGLLAMRIGFSAYVVPFIFTVGGGTILLLQPTPNTPLSTYIITFIDVIIGTISASIGLAGYLWVPQPFWIRVLFVVGGFWFIYPHPGLMDEMIGALIFLVALTVQFTLAKRGGAVSLIKKSKSASR